MTTKTIDPAVSAMLERAEAEGISTAFDRAEAMKPCPIGHKGGCCKNCAMGPCRLVGEDWELPRLPEAKEDESHWFKSIWRTTRTNILDLEMAGDFRKY